MPWWRHIGALAERPYSLFLPMFILTFAVVVLAGFQTGQSIGERRELLNARSNQQQPLTDSRNVRAQLETILAGIDELAAAGNQNAINVRARVNELGLRTPDGG